MNVVPFPGSRRLRRAKAPLQPPTALAHYVPAPDSPSTFDGAEDRLRMQQNLGAFIAVVLIVLLGGWLIDRLTTYSRTLMCIEAGHHSCMPLDVKPSGPWDR
jgi:hypothetical protein